MNHQQLRIGDVWYEPEEIRNFESWTTVLSIHPNKLGEYPCTVKSERGTELMYLDHASIIRECIRLSETAGLSTLLCYRHKLSQRY